MLRLLRKIKPGKREGEKSGSFWRFAIAESVLIFLGILLALQVDNWNQERKDRKLERVLLSEMLGNLKVDLDDIKYSIKYLEQYQNSSQLVLDFLNSDLPWNDSLGRHFAQLMVMVLFDVNTSAYESLKSIGIDLIHNEKLRKGITNVYSVAYNHVQAHQSLLSDVLYSN